MIPRPSSQVDRMTYLPAKSALNVSFFGPVMLFFHLKELKREDRGKDGTAFLISPMIFPILYTGPKAGLSLLSLPGMRSLIPVCTI
jgi:hypothetical protein